MRRSSSAAGLLVLALCGPVWAAGGHHAVDDAVILAPGECGIETWVTRADKDNALLHAGAHCGLGAVELGLASEPTRADGAMHTAYLAQLKWARGFAPMWNVGFSITPAWQTQEHPGYVGTNVSALLTWMPNEQLELNLNAGRDWLREQPDQGRNGASVAWTPQKQWSFIFERYLANATQFARVGARWFATDRWNFDLSRAESLGGARPPNWTVGATLSLR